MGIKGLSALDYNRLRFEFIKAAMQGMAARIPCDDINRDQIAVWAVDLAERVLTEAGKEK